MEGLCCLIWPGLTTSWPSEHKNGTAILKIQNEAPPRRGLQCKASRTPARRAGACRTRTYALRMARGRLLRVYECSHAAVGEPNVAVCLLPGTEVAFEKEVDYEPRGLFSNWIPGKKLGEKVARSGKSRRSSCTCITTRLSSPPGRLCCSRVSVKVSKRLYCNCQLLPARQSKRRSRSALPSSPNRVLQEGRGRRNRSECGAGKQTLSRRERSRQAGAQASRRRDRRSPRGYLSGVRPGFSRTADTARRGYRAFKILVSTTLPREYLSFI
jgi:hypothetical protein